MRITALLSAVLIVAVSACAQEWSAPAEVLHEMRRCVSYKARLSGDMLVIQVTPEAGWHTFVMDNEARAKEKLAGKPSLGIDQPTSIKVSGGLEVAGPWLQSPPKDFSKPELRWFSWGYEQPALFAAKVKKTTAGPVQIGIRGQACTETTCKNIDVTLTLPPTAGSGAAVDVKSLIPVR